MLTPLFLLLGRSGWQRFRRGWFGRWGKRIPTGIELWSQTRDSPKMETARSMDGRNRMVRELAGLSPRFLLGERGLGLLQVPKSAVVPANGAVGAAEIADSSIGNRRQAGHIQVLQARLHVLALLHRGGLRLRGLGVIEKLQVGRRSLRRRGGDIGYLSHDGPRFQLENELARIECNDGCSTGQNPLQGGASPQWPRAGTSKTLRIGVAERIVCVFRHRPL